jgi:hypothetical protein
MTAHGRDQFRWMLKQGISGTGIRQVGAKGIHTLLAADVWKEWLSAISPAATARTLLTTMLANRRSLIWFGT